MYVFDRPTKITDRVTRVRYSPPVCLLLTFLAQDKHTTSGVNERYAFAVSEMQGWRICEHSPTFTASACVTLLLTAIRESPPRSDGGCPCNCA